MSRFLRLPSTLGMPQRAPAVQAREEGQGWCVIPSWAKRPSPRINDACREFMRGAIDVSVSSRATIVALSQKGIST